MFFYFLRYFFLVFLLSAVVTTNVAAMHNDRENVSIKIFNSVETSEKYKVFKVIKLFYKNIGKTKIGKIALAYFVLSIIFSMVVHEKLENIRDISLSSSDTYYFLYMVQYAYLDKIALLCGLYGDGELMITVANLLAYGCCKMLQFDFQLLKPSKYPLFLQQVVQHAHDDNAVKNVEMSLEKCPSLIKKLICDDRDSVSILLNDVVKYIYKNDKNALIKRPCYDFYRQLVVSYLNKHVSLQKLNWTSFFVNLMNCNLVDIFVDVHQKITCLKNIIENAGNQMVLENNYYPHVPYSSYASLIDNWAYNFLLHERKQLIQDTFGFIMNCVLQYHGVGRQGRQQIDQIDTVMNTVMNFECDFMKHCFHILFFQDSLDNGDYKRFVDIYKLMHKTLKNIIDAQVISHIPHKFFQKISSIMREKQQGCSWEDMVEGKTEEVIKTLLIHWITTMVKVIVDVYDPKRCILNTTDNEGFCCLDYLFVDFPWLKNDEYFGKFISENVPERSFIKDDLLRLLPQRLKMVTRLFGEYNEKYFNEILEIYDIQEEDRFGLDRKSFLHILCSENSSNKTTIRIIDNKTRIIERLLEEGWNPNPVDATGQLPMNYICDKLVTLHNLLRIHGAFKENENFAERFYTLNTETSYSFFNDIITIFNCHKINNFSRWSKGIRDFFDQKYGTSRNVLLDAGIDYIHQNVHDTTLSTHIDYVFSFMEFLIPYSKYKNLEIFAGHWLLHIVQRINEVTCQEEDETIIKTQNVFEKFLERHYKIDFSVTDNIGQNVFHYLALSNNVLVFNKIIESQKYHNNVQDIQEALQHKNDKCKSSFSPCEIATHQRNEYVLKGQNDYQEISDLYIDDSFTKILSMNN